MGAGTAARILWALCCVVSPLFNTVVVETASETASGYSPPQQTKGPCNYTVIIETTCAEGAGTSGPVRLRFGDASSTDVLVHPLHTRRVRTVDGASPAVLDDVHKRSFPACATDTFQASGDCVRSRVCYLFLRHGGQDRWRPGRVQVVVAAGDAGGRLSSESFYFRWFLPQHVWHGVDACEEAATPFGARRTRKVHSAGGRGSRSP